MGPTRRGIIFFMSQLRFSFFGLALAILVTACASTSATPASAELPTAALTVVVPTLAQVNSPEPTPEIPTVTPGPTAVLPTATPEATFTPAPTARDVLDPTLDFVYLTPEETPVTAVPTPVERVELDGSVKNILLIGADTTGTEYRSDTMIVVSINQTANTVTMLSIPRDLFVFIPKSLKVMGRINTVINIARNRPEGPIPLLEQTILYNLGIPIHYYARVDFDGFKTIVDALGGIDVPVTCTFQDHRLIDPALDPLVEENWELYTLNAGIHHLDGTTALWYARSRQKTGGGDFDRARRQQEVLRAIYRKAREQNLLDPGAVTSLYNQFSSVVDTDMTLGDILQFLPLALNLDELDVRNFRLSPPYTQGWTTPDGSSVQLPVPDEFYKYVQRAMTAGGTNRASQNPYTVEIWNGTTWGDADDMAAYRLGLEGMRVSIGAPDRADYATTTIYDYTISPKGSPLAQLKKLLKVSGANVVAQPDANSPINFRIILGADYNSCTYTVAPLATATPAP